ncbi:MAG: hypothetical protein V4772_18310 [Pseudomonadota bacterium]
MVIGNIWQAAAFGGFVAEFALKSEELPFGFVLLPAITDESGQSTVCVGRISR